VAAIVFSGNLTLIGWLSRPGIVTRILEALGRCAVLIVEVSL
jgi:hypothetical protein